MQINNNTNPAGNSSSSGTNSADGSASIEVTAVGETPAIPETGQVAAVSSAEASSAESRNEQTDLVRIQRRLVRTGRSLTNQSVLSQVSVLSGHSSASEGSAHSDTQLLPASPFSHPEEARQTPQAPLPCTQRVAGAIRRYTNPAVQLQVKYTSRHSVGLSPQSSGNGTNSTVSNNTSSAARSQQDSSTCPPCNITCPTFPSIFPGANRSTTTNMPSATPASSSTPSISTPNSSSTSSLISSDSSSTANSTNTTAESGSTEAQVQTGDSASFQATVWASNGVQLELEAREQHLLYGNRQISLHSEAGVSVGSYMNLEVSANTGVSTTREGASSFFTSTRSRVNLGINNLTTSSNAIGNVNSGFNIRTEHHWDQENRSRRANQALGAALGLSHLAGGAIGLGIGSNFAAPTYGASIGGAAGSMLATHALNMFPLTRSDRVVRSVEPEVTAGFHAGSSQPSGFEFEARIQPRIRFEEQFEEVPLVEEEIVRPIPPAPRRTGTEGTIVRRRRNRNISFGNPDIELADITNGDNNSSTDV